MPFGSLSLGLGLTSAFFGSAVSTWILATGAWRDIGFWDDTAVWKDS